MKSDSIFAFVLEIRVTEYPDGFDVEYEIKQAKDVSMVLGLSNPEG